MKMIKKASLATLFSLTLTGTAWAHPHVWTDTVTRFVFEDQSQTLASVESIWVFDELFSQTLVDDFDKDGDGTFSKAEETELGRTILQNIKEFDFFIHIKVDGKKLRFETPKSFAAQIVQGRVGFRFNYALPEPVDAKAHDVMVATYDPEYYIDLSPIQGQEAQIVGRKDKACSFQMIDDLSTPLYGGLAYPLAISLNCQ